MIHKAYYTMEKIEPFEERVQVVRLVCGESPVVVKIKGFTFKDEEVTCPDCLEKEK